MKKIIYIFLGLIIFSMHAKSQTKQSIIDELNASRNGQGKITIYQDNVIRNIIGTPNASAENNVNQQLNVGKDSPSSNTTEKVNTVKARGFRIQVYSGNDQKTSRAIAYSRRDAVRSAYPNMGVTIAYHSPTWRVRAGNFRSRAEAQQALVEMKSKLPAFGREMHIVDDVVKVPVN